MKCLRIIFALFAAFFTRITAADPLLLDMVHNNPGEPPFVTRYTDPDFLKSLGYTGKVFFLFDSAQLAVNWESVDPSLLPPNSDARRWIDQKAADLDKKYAAAKAAGLEVFCESDLILFPKALVEKENLAEVMGNPADPRTQKYLGLLLDQMFTRFPQLDGIVVRIGETYLQDAPFHVGKITDKADAAKTITPLVRFLREHVCEKLHKKVIFRTWLSFDTDAAKYLAVSDAVEPHPNLIFSIKHCEGDFHRGNPPSKILGTGRHRFIVEVECQREYEGKGAYPNYIAHGVIDGFEEDAANPLPHSLVQIRKSPLYAGVWTWSRGGGWEGPYITNEFWCDLNTQIVAAWTRNPDQSESELFENYCTPTLKLGPDDAARFRQLALRSADAVIRGKRSLRTTPADTVSPFWTRDHFVGRPPLPGNPAARADFLAEKDESIRIWREMVDLANAIHFPDPATTNYVQTSTHYGLELYRIYRAGFHLSALTPQAPPGQTRPWLAEYDDAWANLKKLKQDHPSCATLYKDTAFRDKPGIGTFVNEFPRPAAP